MPEFISDVPSGTWFHSAMLWALQGGVVTGTSATTLSPNDPVTREQFALMLYRLAHGREGWTDTPDIALDHFADQADISNWAYDAMRWAYYHNLITGSTATMLNPQGTLTRAQCASILMRYMQTFEA